MTMKTVVLAEKPSVAADIARALGVPKTARGFYESGDVIVTNAYGHLVEIDDSGFNGERRGLDGLPVLTDTFPLRVSSGGDARRAKGVRDQFDLVASLMRRQDVGTLVNACDAGREGELIFRYIVAAIGVRKPEYRLWLQSMTSTAIVAGFRSLRPGAAMVPLAHAAICRSEADFLVGINGSRMLSAVRGSSSPVGRVRTPTMALMVVRERAIRAFKSVAFWEVIGKFGVKGGEFSAGWVGAGEVAGGEGAEGDGSVRGRLFDRRQAEAVVGKCSGRNPTWIRDETKPLVKEPPLLFDLTALQQEANRRFGFAAKVTLDAAQSLYETHKSLTYPRTDARALPEDYAGTVMETLAAMAGWEGADPAVMEIVHKHWVDEGNRRIFNNAKISDHFAIIPTGRMPGTMTEVESKVFGLVMRRFLAAFFPSARFAVTTRTVDVVGERFVVTGRVLVATGWLAVEKEVVEEGAKVEAALPALVDGETGVALGMGLREGATKAPPRYTEATLLGAMGAAGKDLAGELREAMKECGLGTPATRAATIEKLVGEGYVRREGRMLVPSEEAFSVMAALEEMGAQELTSAEMTGEWESKLARMAAGGYSRTTFMGEIAAECHSLVEKGRRKGAAVVPACPLCEKPMVKRVGKKGAFWGCSGYPGCKGVGEVEGVPGAGVDGGGAGGVGVGGGKVAGKTSTGGKGAGDKLATGACCPECRKGKVIGRTFKDSGKAYFGCTAFPKCRLFRWCN